MEVFKNITESQIEKVRCGAEFYLRKKGVGSIRKNCVLAKNANDIPIFLIEDGAVEVDNNGRQIILHAVEGAAKRSFPVYICWEPVSQENYDQVPGIYGAWPKDNGSTTLKVVDGKCYNLPEEHLAALVIEAGVPDWIDVCGFPVHQHGETYELIRTDWGGDVRMGRIEEALWVLYGPQDVNILSLAEESAESYVAIIDGKEYSLEEVFG